MYQVQGFNQDGAPLSLVAVASLDEAAQALDQAVIDGAHSVEVLRGITVVYEFYPEWSDSDE